MAAGRTTTGAAVVEGRSDAAGRELVAILLRVGFKGTNAVELARQLLKQFGSLRGMVEAPVIALLEVKGLKGTKDKMSKGIDGTATQREINQRAANTGRSDGYIGVSLLVRPAIL